MKQIPDDGTQSELDWNADMMDEDFIKNYGIKIGEKMFYVLMEGDVDLPVVALNDQHEIKRIFDEIDEKESMLKIAKLESEISNRKDRIEQYAKDIESLESELTWHRGKTNFSTGGTVLF